MKTDDKKEISKLSSPKLKQEESKVNEESISIKENLRFDQIFLKYKFLLHIVKREDEEYFTQEDLDNYYELIYNCKKPNEYEIQEEIRNKLLSKYRKIFPKDKILTRQLSLVLEQFFDIK